MLALRTGKVHACCCNGWKMNGVRHAAFWHLLLWLVVDAYFDNAIAMHIKGDLQSFTEKNTRVANNTACNFTINHLQPAYTAIVHSTAPYMVRSISTDTIIMAIYCIHGIRNACMHKTSMAWSAGDFVEHFSAGDNSSSNFSHR